MVVYLSILLTALVVSWALTGWIRRYALAKSLIDIPNSRSSHSVPVPRGGGLSVVLVCSIGFVGLWLCDWLALNEFLALFGAGSIVALVGFLDDHEHVAARWRLMVHFIGAIWALVCLGGLPAFPFFHISVELGIVGYVIAAFYLVWLLNLYNFMDGIDGIAGLEAMTVLLSAACVLTITHENGVSQTLILLLVCMAVAGFLLWNFPKAKIFMGDACSGFLGLTLGILSLQAAWNDGVYLWVWLILLGVFIVDATFTLVRRVLRGEPFYQAHRSHAYQFASRKYQSHVKVSLGVALLNLFWLLPVGLCVALEWIEGFLGVVIAYLPLILLAYKLNAGGREQDVDVLAS